MEKIIKKKLRLNRSQLAVPGTRKEFFEKAANGDADIIFLDLEDLFSLEYQLLYFLSHRTFPFLMILNLLMFVSHLLYSLLLRYVLVNEFLFGNIFKLLIQNH